jgi:hypothetical protein
VSNGISRALHLVVAWLISFAATESGLNRVILLFVGANRSSGECKRLRRSFVYLLAEIGGFENLRAFQVLDMDPQLICRRNWIALPCHIDLFSVYSNPVNTYVALALHCKVTKVTSHINHILL